MAVTFNPVEAGRGLREKAPVDKRDACLSFALQSAILGGGLALFFGLTFSKLDPITTQGWRIGLGVATGSLLVTTTSFALGAASHSRNVGRYHEI